MSHYTRVRKRLSDDDKKYNRNCYPCTHLNNTHFVNSNTNIKEFIPLSNIPPISLNTNTQSIQTKNKQTQSNY